jgi:hypothetical protein
MENKNGKFLEKYFAEEDRKKQLSLLKNYMLSLSPEDLKKFMLEPLDFLEKALKSSEVKPEQKKKIFDHLDEMIFLMKGKMAA